MKPEDTRTVGLFWLAAFSVALLYVLTVCILPAHVFWSPDEGGKFLQALGVRYTPSSGDDVLAYGAVGHDPRYVFYPPGSVYPRLNAAGQVSFGWPFLFPVLSSFAYAFLGIRGLYLLPVVSGIAAAILAGAIARRIATSLGWITVLAVGLCSPLWFYSVLFWEHSFAVMMALGATYATLMYLDAKTGAKRLLWLALMVPCLLIAILTRFDMLIFAAVEAAAFIFVSCRHSGVPTERLRRHFAVYATAIGGLGIAALSIYSLSAAGTHVFPSYFALFQGAYHRLTELSLQSVYPLAGHVRKVLVNDASDFGVDVGIPFAAVCLLAVLLALVCVLFRPRFRNVVVPMAAAVVSVAALFALLSPTRYRALHGILMAAPYCAFGIAALPIPGDKRDHRRALMVTLSFAYLLVFLLASFFVGAQTGGPEWGTRYGLIVFPLLAIMALVGISTLLENGRRVMYKAAVLCIAGCAFAISCQSAVRGIMEIQVTKWDLAAFDHKFRSLSLPVVTDQWWMGAAIAPYFAKHELYTVRDTSDVRTNWLPAVVPTISRFVYASYGEGLDHSTQGMPCVELSHSVLNGMSFRIYEVRHD